VLTAGLSKHARRGCLEKLNNSMTGHILERARTHACVYAETTAVPRRRPRGRAPRLNDVAPLLSHLPRVLHPHPRDADDAPRFRGPRSVPGENTAGLGPRTVPRERAPASRGLMNTNSRSLRDSDSR